jgi:FtsP/CotA-like multicopper oxidase with cupredoxin domain
MNNRRKITHALSAIAILLTGLAQPAQAAIQGITGHDVAGVRTFDLIAAPFHISTPDGSRHLMWGYGVDGGVPQYPGPTLIIDEGDDVAINIVNNGLPQAISIVFPGQSDVGAVGDSVGLLTAEANDSGGTATYTFTASHPGTYYYQSGTQQVLQVEMGLIGVIVIRPLSGLTDRAYNHEDSRFDNEYLFLFTEMDPQVHLLMEFGLTGAINNTTYRPMLWFINGRPGFDSLSPDNVAWLPNQPYGALALTNPGQTNLMRMIGGSRHGHPFHPHGNHHRVIARDGRMLSSGPGAGPDLSVEQVTTVTWPGATYDAFWDWTGEKLGWDIYGGPKQGHSNNPHYCTNNDLDDDDFHDTTFEYCPDHGKPFPLILPELQDLAFGGFYSGSPFFGASADLPPGEGGLNIAGGLFHIWHSHNEKEIVNNDVPVGGILTMMAVLPHSVPIGQ